MNIPLQTESQELRWETKHQMKLQIIDEVETFLHPPTIFLTGIIHSILSYSESDLTSVLRKNYLNEIIARFCLLPSKERTALIPLCQLTLEKDNGDKLLSNYDLNSRQYSFISSLFEEMQTNFEAQINSSSSPHIVPLAFITELTTKQLKFLYKELRKADYIDHRTSEETFVMVFSGVPISELKGETIIWTNKGRTTHKPNAKTLYELLFLLKKHMPHEILTVTTSKRIYERFVTEKKANNLYSKINKCFSGLNGVNEKNPNIEFSEPQGGSPDKDKLKEIVTAMENI
ncbi:hypothetical protein DWB61_01670 [Ancylomarina euxinus]|uniref:Uncharacterized protein n=1 Tax=Ancylomarina euxinus TaxID=2283627 RepID=A0A425Y8U4_9BACT|nr:hypothetical protein [Ancylomarina euxinus]MCZ4693382.1 hypothetical protein [Ancylomarina euxinus]MUP13610.1 hypothetical protein [Ancylomarina euxinus]RRG24744.1 hypothetical protein DWB61_01670 [Ancylomarina euxinus]